MEETKTEMIERNLWKLDRICQEADDLQDAHSKQACILEIRLIVNDLLEDIGS